MRSRTTAWYLASVLLLGAGPSSAFTGATSSQGEANPVLIGEFNCLTGNGTELTLTNGDPLRGYCACVQVQSGFRGAGGLIFVESEGLVDVRDLDTDTINICSMLPGRAGRIEVVMFRSVGINNNCNNFRDNPVEGGLYGWTTDVSADGRAKSELLAVPAGVESPFLARNLCTNPITLPATAFLNGSFE